MIYGYGGVKLSTQPLRDATKWNVDQPQVLVQSPKAVQVISNITAFNTDEWNNMESGIQRMCKLSKEVKMKKTKNDLKLENRTR